MRTLPARIIKDPGLTQRVTGEADNPDRFVFTAEISNNNLDAYFSHMDESTLRNFANDAANGVQLLDSHNSKNLGYGRSLQGTFQAEGETHRTIADFFTVRGIQFGGGGPTFQSTDDFIKAIESGIARDVSVGFHGGDEVCDICGEPIWGWRSNCPHFPGVEYPIGEQGEKTIIATYTISDARLSEVSVVFDGATPEAMITKAQRMAEAGEIDLRVAGVLRVRHKIELPEKYKNWPGTDLSNGRSAERGKRMNEFEQAVEKIRSILAETGAPDNAELPEQVRWLVSENERLRPLADDGRAYRADLINEALAEGVRAHGEKFASEAYRGMLEASGLEAIKRMRDDWKAIGDSRFAGGRQTENEEDKEERERPSIVPNSAYEV